MDRRRISVLSDEEDSEDEAFKPKRQSSTKSKVKTDSAKNAKKNSGNVRQASRKKVSASSSKKTESSVADPGTSRAEDSNVKKNMNLQKVDITVGADDILIDETFGVMNSDFCPLCQVPLKLLKISADMHTSSCNVTGNLPDCPDGISCLSSNIFHYRDFSHHKLAAFRDSEDYVAPDIVFTPAKAKRKSPLKVSAGKKRPSKSPVTGASSKIMKTDEDPCCSKDIPLGSPDMFSEGSSSVVPHETKKRLSFSDDPSEQKPESQIYSKEILDQEKETVVAEESSESFTDKLEEAIEEICSDLFLDEESQQDEPSNSSHVSALSRPLDLNEASTPVFDANDAEGLLGVKDEPLSQISDSENIGTTSNNAKVMIYYNMGFDGTERSVDRKKIECSESCVLPADHGSSNCNTLQATCSILIESKGIRKEEAMARSPISVTLMVNNSGWEAVDIKGKPSCKVQNVEVSLCQCSHSVCVKCSVEAENFDDVKFNPEDVEQQDKFFASMTDLGLKSQETYVQPVNYNLTETKTRLMNTCHQITLSSAVKPDVINDPLLYPPCETVLDTREESTSDSSRIQESNAATSSKASDLHENVQGVHLARKVKCEDMKPNSLAPMKPMAHSFPLKSSLSEISKTERPASPSSPLWSKNGVAQSFSPMPGPLMVSKTTGSSWTLVPSMEKPAPSKKWGQVNGSKKVPAYKRIPDTQIVVDAFNYGVIPGVKAYFLSHFHADHYIGLRKGFSMPIFCSQATANLVHLKLRVDKEYLHVLNFGEPRVVCGVEVDIFDANHCPGAVMFLFRLMDGRTFLHVGDFRAHPRMEEFPQLRLVDKLFLDTTYCDPAYNFPSQEEVVAKVVSTVQEHLHQSKSTLFVCGTYTIGKEKVFMGIAEEFNWKIWTSTEKRRVLHCLEDKEILNRLTTDPLVAQVHVLAMRDIALEELFQHLNKYSAKYSHIVGFKPTGWTTSTSLKGKPSDFQKSTRGKVTIYGVPYSEHSSFTELRRFVRFIKPKDIQVTVNLGKSSQYKKMFQQWLSNTRDDAQSKMIHYFTSMSREPSR